MATQDRDQNTGSRTPRGSLQRTRDEFGWGNWNMDPFSQLRRLSDQMERWFDAAAPGRSGRGSSTLGASMRMWAPEIETFARDDQFIIRADLPGLNKDDVTVEVTDDRVMLQGERTKTQEEEREGYYRSERSYGRFYREVPLPEGAQPETAQANYRDGVLEISVNAPPRQTQQPRRVEIGTSSATSTGSSSSQATDRTSPRPERAVAHEQRSADKG